jgi:predicted transcriptional regulator
MGQTLTIRLTTDLADWLRETAQESGVPQGRIVREALEKAREHNDRKRYMRLAGTVRGPGDLSRRKGFTR